MNPESISPEQRAKFMTGFQISQLGQETPRKNIKPFLYGLLTAVLIFSGLFVLNSSGAKEVLLPFATKDGTSPKSAEPTVENPLTGEMIKEADALTWKDSRPIGVMINNHTSARQQSGLVDADLIYEIVAEGGITRYLSFFLSKLPEKIGPVRSTREYYLVLVKELSDAMIMHIGYSPQALEAIETWPVRSLSRGGATFWRDQTRIDSGIAIEHTAYVNGPELRELGNQLGWEGKGDFEPWKFKDDAKIELRGAACASGTCDKPITVNFWYPGDYTGIFKYNRQTNSYLRFTGYDQNNQPIPLIDQESKRQIEVKNVIIQFVTEVPITGDDKSRLEYRLVGSGQAIIFNDGNVAKAVWRKDARDTRTKYYDSNGQEILFNRGKIWVSIVPDRNIEQVTY